jgi:hypothetical protein
LIRPLLGGRRSACVLYQRRSNMGMRKPAENDGLIWVKATASAAGNCVEIALIEGASGRGIPAAN